MYIYIYNMSIYIYTHTHTYLSLSPHVFPGKSWDFSASDATASPGSTSKDQRESAGEGSEDGGGVAVDMAACWDENEMKLFEKNRIL